MAIQISNNFDGQLQPMPEQPYSGEPTNVSTQEAWLRGRRIGYLIPSIPPDFGGGGQRMYRQARYMANHGVQSVVFTLTQSNKDALARLQVVPVRAPGSLSRLRGPLAGVRHASAFVPFSWLFKRSDIELLHILGCSAWTTVAHIVARLQRIPVVVETTLVGADDPVTIGNSRLGELKLSVMKRADALVSVSPLLDQLADSAGIAVERRHIIENPIDVDRFRPADEMEKRRIREKLGITTGSLVFAYVGVLRPRKGVDALLEAFIALAVGHPEACLVLVGPTHKDDENHRTFNALQVRARESGVAHRVIFAGEVANPDEWLKASDVFWFASLREGFPNAQIEAMATGLPVVARRIPGITDSVITEGVDGFIVDDMQAFLTRSRELACDAELRSRLGSAARLTVCRRYNEHELMSRYMALYHSILERHTKQRTHLDPLP